MFSKISIFMNQTVCDVMKQFHLTVTSKNNPLRQENHPGTCLYVKLIYHNELITKKYLPNSVPNKIFTLSASCHHPISSDPVHLVSSVIIVGSLDFVVTTSESGLLASTVLV